MVDADLSGKNTIVNLNFRNRGDGIIPLESQPIIIANCFLRSVHEGIAVKSLMMMYLYKTFMG